jgi:hypothetical protein
VYSANLIITPPRKNRPVSNPTVVLEINNIHVLKNVMEPLFSEKVTKKGSKLRILQSKKFKDFCD